MEGSYFAYQSWQRHGMPLGRGWHNRLGAVCKEGSVQEIRDSAHSMPIGRGWHVFGTEPCAGEVARRRSGMVRTESR